MNKTLKFSAILLIALFSFCGKKAPETNSEEPASVPAKTTGGELQEIPAGTIQTFKATFNGAVSDADIRFTLDNGNYFELHALADEDKSGKDFNRYTDDMVDKRYEITVTREDVNGMRKRILLKAKPL